MAAAVQPDYVQLFVQVYPPDSAADVVNIAKGATRRALREAFPHLRTRPSWWTRSFFIATVGSVRETTIRQSIVAQKGV